MSEFSNNTEQARDNGSDSTKEKAGGRKEVALALGLSAMALFSTQLERGSGYGKFRSIEGFKEGSIAKQVVEKIGDFFTDKDGNVVYSTPDGSGGTVDFMIGDDAPREGGYFSEPTSEDGKVIDLLFPEDENVPYSTPENPEK